MPAASSVFLRTLLATCTRHRAHTKGHNQTVNHLPFERAQATLQVHGGCLRICVMGSGGYVLQRVCVCVCGVVGRTCMQHNSAPNNTTLHCEQMCGIRDCACKYIDGWEIRSMLCASVAVRVPRHAEPGSAVLHYVRQSGGCMLLMVLAAPVGIKMLWLRGTTPLVMACSHWLSARNHGHNP